MAITKPPENKKPNREPLKRLTPNLKEALAKAEKLFAGAPQSGVFRFSLSLRNSRWKFEIVDSWALWMDAGLSHEFWADTAETAVNDFLKYVAKHKVNVLELMIKN